MSDAEYGELLQRFPDFAVLAPNRSMTPELRWHGARRVLQSFNYPNHPDDVRNPFGVADHNAMTDSVPFHVLCLLFILSRRNPVQCYHMTTRLYESSS
ncbi:hypothetical protein Q4I30_003856 [Leishmania utingensis]|uniref:Uncharacterized protein n=1 Tax=Leishmania utingensis TaxID=653362 RepID=A0AAW3AIC6_9TRYP